MSKTVHNFANSFKVGKSGEWVIDKWLSKHYVMTKSNRAQERLGYDFNAVSKRSGNLFKLEVKTDEQTQKTGNLFIETMSVVEQEKKGWALTSTADILIYYLWGKWDVLFFDMKTVRRFSAEKGASYRQIKVRNNDYTTKGFLLPLSHTIPLLFAKRSGVDAYWMKENYKSWLRDDDQKATSAVHPIATQSSFDMAYSQTGY